MGERVIMFIPILTMLSFKEKLASITHIRIDIIIIKISNPVLLILLLLLSFTLNKSFKIKNVAKTTNKNM